MDRAGERRHRVVQEIGFVEHHSELDERSSPTSLSRRLACLVANAPTVRPRCVIGREGVATACRARKLADE